RRGAPAAGAHLAIAIPFALLDRELAANLADEPAITPDLPAPLDDVRIVLRSATLADADGERLRFRLAVALGDGDRELAAGAGDVDAVPRVEQRADRLVLGLTPLDLRDAHLVLADDARDRIASELASRVPAVARSTVAAIAGRLVDWVGSQTLAHLL